MLKRYEISPQMIHYDNLGIQWTPYTMFSSRPNYKSNIVNTDQYGLRYSGRSDTYSIDHILPDEHISIVVGGSTAFGVGATHDSNTISSNINTTLGRKIINLGGRAYNSRQELILFLHFLRFFKYIDEVFIVSGVNNLYLSSFSENFYPPFFFSRQFYINADNATLSVKRKIFKNFLTILGIENVRINEKRFSDLFSLNWWYINFSKKKKNNKLKINFDNALRNTLDDLLTWKKLSDAMKFKLVFALQPMPSWSNKRLVDKEVELFETLNNEGNFILKQLEDISIYNNYSRRIQSACLSNDIHYIDINKTLNNNYEWIFVDRVHLTDLGYFHLSNQLLQDSLS